MLRPYSSIGRPGLESHGMWRGPALKLANDLGCWEKALVFATTQTAPFRPRMSLGSAASSRSASESYTRAIGRIGDPVPPTIFIGTATKTNCHCLFRDSPSRSNASMM